MERIANSSKLEQHSECLDYKNLWKRPTSRDLIITALTGVYELAYRKRVLSAGGKLWSLTHCPDPWQLKSRIHCWKKGWVLQRAGSQLGTFFTTKKRVSMLVDRFGCHGWEWQGPDVTGSLQETLLKC